MKFTLVFPSDEASDLSIGVIFAPCLIWTIGNKHILNAHSSNPHYVLGDFQELILKITNNKKINFDVNRSLGRKIFVVVHDIGHGTEDYLRDLVSDIQKSGFRPVICR
jgi:hypothetical protein